MQSGDRRTDEIGPPIEAEDYKVVKDNRHRSPFQLSVRRFFKNKLAVLGLIILILVILVAIFAPFFAEHDPTKTDMIKIEQSPSKERSEERRVGKEWRCGWEQGQKAEKTIEIKRKSEAEVDTESEETYDNK